MTTERMILRRVLLLERPPEEAEDEASDSEAVGMGAAACVSVMPVREVSEDVGSADEEEVVDIEEVRDELDVGIVDEDDVDKEIVEEDDVVAEVVDDEVDDALLLIADEEDVEDSCFVLRLELVDESKLVDEGVLAAEVVLLVEVMLLVLDTAEEEEEDVVKVPLLGVVGATVPLGVTDHIHETT